MQSTSQVWRDLFAAGAALETRATIGGTAYADISAPVVNRALMQDRLSVGNVVSASLALAVRGAGSIPRSAAVVVETRLNDGVTASEWLPQGTFYISRRMRDPVTGVLALECYDALLKANALWTPSAGTWPRTMAAVVAELAALLGVSLDSRTVIPSGAAFVVSEPAAGTTIRDALSVVAQAAGGNWIMTPANRLRLVRLGEVGGAVAVAGVVGGIEAAPAGAITGVRSTVDGLVTLIGDDTGIVVDVTIAPVIAADMADALIGLSYQPYSLAGAIYDPAAELGDGVSAGAGGEVSSALCSEQATLGPAFRGDIAAPAPGEVTDEYPYIGGAEKTLALAKAAVAEAVEAFDDTLTQQEIFNRLTDNGAAQGLVLYNGQLYINASYINTGYLNVGRIDFNDPPTYCNVPDENDVDSLFSGQTVVDGWIVNTSGTGKITILSCGFALPLHGKTVSVTFEYNGQLSGGSDSWYGISDEVELVGGFRDWEMPAGRTPENPYTLDFYVDNDMQGFSMSVNCSGVRRISVSLDSPVTPSTDIVYDYRGQRIGTFHVYRDGTLETYEKSLFNGPTRIGKLYLNEPLGVDYGGTGADNAADARTKLDITPANIGAISKWGNENGIMFGYLSLRNGDDSSSPPSPAGGHLQFLRGSDGKMQAFVCTNETTVYFETYRDPGNYYGGREGYSLPSPTQTSGWAGYSILTTKSPVLVTQGGTGATTPAGACAALAPGIPTAAYTLIPNSNYGPNVSGGIEPLRCVKYGNGLKRLIGVINITGNGAQDGGLICTVPTGFEHVLNNNGGLQGWVTITRSSEGNSYLALFNGSHLKFWGQPTVPTGVYAINYLYF